MKNKMVRLSTVGAILSTVISFGLIIASLIISTGEEPPEEMWGVARSFALWVYSIIFALISMVFYFIDAIRAIARMLKGVNPLFNLLAALLFIGAIPLVITIGGSPRIANIIIWFSYYVLIFILEIKYISKHRT